MTSYSTSRDYIPHPPGSFPTDTTPTTEDPSSTSSEAHCQHNKPLKHENPGSWSNEEKFSRGHQHKDSGIGLGEGNEYVIPKTTTRPAEHHSSESKPGVMTGAYSRVDDNNSSRIISSPITLDQTAKYHTTAGGTGSAGPAADVVAGTTPVTSDQKLRNGNGDAIRSGLGQPSGFGDQDPYWGDISYGTGVYNTVTGHGSSETPAEGSVPAHWLPLSHEQQRTIPLGTSDNTTRGEAARHEGPRFKDSVAKTGAGVSTGGPTSHEYEEDTKPARQHESIEEKKLKDYKTDKENKRVAFFHHSHDDKASKPAKKEKAQARGLQDPFIAAGYTGPDSQSTVRATDKSYQSSTDKTMSSYQDAPKATGSSLSNPETGVVGSSKTAILASEKKRTVPSTNSSRSGEYNTVLDDTPSGTNAIDHYPDKNRRTVSPSNATYNGMTKDNHAGAKAAAVGAGAVGAGATMAHYVGQRDKDRDEIAAPETPKALSQLSSKKAHEPYTDAAGHALGDSSHGEMYKFLSSGTPSEMNFGDGSPHQYQDKQHSNAVPSETDAPFNRSVNESHYNHGNNIKAATAAGAVGVVGAGAAKVAHHTRRTSSDDNGNDDSNSKKDIVSSIYRQQLTTDASSAAATDSSSNKKTPSMNSITNTSSRNRASTDSSHGGQYNVLASGTPSGINISDRDSRHSHDGSGSKALSPTPKTVGENTAHYDTGVTAAHAETPTPKKNTTANATTATAVTAAGAGAGAGIAFLASGSGQRVVYRCRKCGDENDISEYFHKK
ncbi:hypothetical protein AAE478_002115 [Parahypoxylon ruwenzoriense]